MDVTKLAAIVSLIFALSIASERLVEIIKGFVPALGKEQSDAKAESRRHAWLQVLAVASGILTAYLAQDYVPKEVADSIKGFSVLGLGLLASGGSGFWNSVLTYVTKVKDIKKSEAEMRKNEVHRQNAENSR
jgi:hypothetical protein